LNTLPDGVSTWDLLPEEDGGSVEVLTPENVQSQGPVPESLRRAPRGRTHPPQPHEEPEFVPDWLLMEALSQLRAPPSEDKRVLSGVTTRSTTASSSITGIYPSEPARLP
jgi:hypothetical protein